MAGVFDETLVEETNIRINASELASAIGEHYYQPKEETLRKVWKRTDPQSFYFAMAQNYRRDVAKIISLNFPFQATFPAQMDFDSDDGTRIFLAVLREVALNDCAKHIFRDVKRFLDRKEFRDAKDMQILTENGLMQEVKAATNNLCANETKKIESVVQEIVKKSGIQTDEVKKALTSQITKNRGTKLENQAVTKFSEEKNIRVRQIPGKLFAKYMKSDGISWVLNGRVDGLTDDKVIEVKNRRSKFMCPMYDYIQIQAYLFLADKKDAILLERLRGQNKETELTCDCMFWEEYVTPMLGKFVMDVANSVDYHTSCLYDTSGNYGPKLKMEIAMTSGQKKKEIKTEKSGRIENENNSVEEEAKEMKVLGGFKITSEARPLKSNDKDELCLLDGKTNCISESELGNDDRASVNEKSFSEKIEENGDTEADKSNNIKLGSKQANLSSDIVDESLSPNSVLEILPPKRAREEDVSIVYDKVDESPPKRVCIIA